MVLENSEIFLSSSDGLQKIDLVKQINIKLDDSPTSFVVAEEGKTFYIKNIGYSEESPDYLSYICVLDSECIEFSGFINGLFIHDDKLYVVSSSFGDEGFMYEYDFDLKLTNELIIGIGEYPFVVNNNIVFLANDGKVRSNNRNIIYDLEVDCIPSLSYVTENFAIVRDFENEYSSIYKEGVLFKKEDIGASDIMYTYKDVIYSISNNPKSSVFKFNEQLGMFEEIANSKKENLKSYYFWEY